MTMQANTPEPNATHATVVVHGNCAQPQLALTFRSLEQHTPSSVSVAVVEPETRDAVLSEMTLAGLRKRLMPEAIAVAPDEGALDILRRITFAEPRADVVLLQAGVEVSTQWIVRLQEAAYSDSVCASVSAVVVSRAGPMPTSASPTSESTSDATPLPLPVIEAPAWGAVYVRRDALNLALADVSETGSTLLDRLSEALSAPGLVNRLAHEVTVRFDGPAPGVAAPPTLNRVDPVIARALDVVAARRGPLPVMIDARCLDRPVSGTTVHITSLAKALAETGEAETSVLVPRTIHESNRPYFEALRDAAEVVHADAIAVRPTIFHRPFQVASEYDLLDCLSIARRFVLTHQDMILDRTRGYFPSEGAWRAFRRMTAASLASADHVGFFSRHAALDASADGVVVPDKMSVVPLGVDHLDGSSFKGQASRPSMLEGLGDKPFLLVLGHAYRHKNRLFALRLLDELVRRHGWDGALVLAGADPVFGSSVPQEYEFLLDRPALQPHVVDVGPVTELQKRWLYTHSSLVLFPSLYEGFGLIPFEAAAHGAPCVYGWRSSLCEYLPEEGAVLEGWDVGDCSKAVVELLQGGARAESLVAAIREAATGLTWARTAEGYVDVYRRALHAPLRFRVAASPDDTAGLGDLQVGLTEHERRVIDVYRRRSSFRRGVEGVIRAGARVGALGRAVRRTVKHR